MAIVRECATPGCREPRIPGGRRMCVRHRQTTTERGYGIDHQAVRRDLERALPAPCAYGCGHIVTRSIYVAAHVIDGDPSAGYVAACRSCNERAKGGALRPTRAATVVG